MPLNDHDSDLIRRESGLPGLQTLLDDGALGERIADDLGLSKASAELEYLRYKPGVNCVAGFSFAGDGLPGIGYAKAFSAADAGKISKPSMRRPLASGLPSTLVLDDLRIVVHFFPGDRRLRALSKLSHPEPESKLVRRLIKNASSGLEAHLEPIRYKPERRLVARLRLSDGRSLALKFLTPGQFAKVRSSARLAERLHGLRSPKLVANSRGLHLLAFQWLDGATLTEQLRKETPWEHSIASTAGMMVGFHRLETNKLRPRTTARVLAEVSAAVSSANHILPELRDRVSAIHPKLDLALEALGDGPLVPIHGDFNTDQILVGEGESAILDFDRAALGWRESDAGSMVARLYYDGLRGLLSRTTDEEGRALLLQTYRNGGEPLDERALDLCTVISLLQLLPQPFRSREDGWPALTTGLANRALELLSTVGSGSPVAPGGLDGLTESKLLAASTDVETMDGRLGHLKQESGVAGEVDRGVVSATVLKRRQGRRFVIAYGMASGPSLVGKARFKGLDTRSWALQNAMWDGAFGPSATDGIRIARPVGMIPDLNMWLQEKVEAQDGWAAFDSTSGIRDSTAIVARTIAKIQRDGPRTGRFHSVARELDGLTKQLAAAASERPELQSLISELEPECRRLAGTLPVWRPWPAHRDFHPGNVLIDDGGAWLLDLDLYCLSHPALDAGNYLGHVWEAAVRGQIGSSQAELFESCFLDFVSQGEHALVTGEVRIFATLTLARLVAVSRRIEERREFTRDILNAALDRIYERTDRIATGSGGPIL